MVKARGQITVTNIQDGTSVKIVSTETTYQISNSGTTPPTGTWTVYKSGVAIPVATDARPYLWTRTTVIYNSGSPVVSYSVSCKGKDGKSVNRNLALDTSAEWSEWITLGNPNKFNAYTQKNWDLCEEIEEGTNVTAAIEVEVKPVNTSERSVFHTHCQPGGIYKTWSKEITLRNGINYYVDRRTTQAKSNRFIIQYRADYGTYQFRVRCLKVEYGTEATAYIPNEADLKGAAAEAYYSTPAALIVTERLNTKDGEDYSARDKKYTDKDYVYDIPSTFAIHHTVGADDTIVKATSWSCTEGATALPSGWQTTLQNSYKTGTGYSLTSIITAANLKGHSDVKQITLTATVADGVTLQLPIYVNRLGTMMTTTYGDTTETIRKKDVVTLQQGITGAQDAADKAQTTANNAQTTANNAVTKTAYEADTKTTAEKFTQVYSKQTEIAAGEGSAVDIDLSAEDPRDALMVVFDYVDSPDLFTFGVKKSLYAPYDQKVDYGTYKLENDKGGFESYVQWQEHYSGWGAREIGRVVNAYSKKWIINNEYAISGIGQWIANGPVYVYLRGGAKYHVFCDHVGVNIHAIQTPAQIAEWPEDSNNPRKPDFQVSSDDEEEPVPENTAIRSEIKQTADQISLLITNLKEKTGIDITQGVINAIAGKFNFADSNGKPYIIVSKDTSGYPHFEFIDPNTGKTAYDLGYTGLQQITNTAQRQSWETVRYNGNYPVDYEASPEELFTAAQFQETAFIYHAAYFRSGHRTIFTPASDSSGNSVNTTYDNVMFMSDKTGYDTLPVSATNKIADGWHMLFKGREFHPSGTSYTDETGYTFKQLDASYDIARYGLFRTEGGREVESGCTLTVYHYSGKMKFAADYGSSEYAAKLSASDGKSTKLLSSVKFFKYIGEEYGIEE